MTDRQRTADEMMREYKAKRRRHNILIAPLVLFVSTPLLLPFWILSRIGEWAEAAGEVISQKLPGFK